MKPNRNGDFGAEPNDPNTRRPQSPTPPYKPWHFGVKPTGTHKIPPKPNQRSPSWDRTQRNPQRIPKSQRNPTEMGILGAEPNDPNTHRPQSPTPPYKPWGFGVKPTGTYRGSQNPNETQQKWGFWGQNPTTPTPADPKVPPHPISHAILG